MSLPAGARFGSYEVVSAIGSGGMGEVYRARDTQLKRDVALKVLPASVASDPDRLARFQREAEILASLNHPNIAAIHGLADAGAVKALVLELVEGPTLADRIAQGPVPLDEALPIARQIADALEAAHGLGIVHRDLKPANIKVRPDGTVKVLDFGLARATAASDAAGAADGMNSPTMLSPARTEIGLILGTAAYMAPEQARGRAVDKRADIWAFGCVLYEMVTGQRLFAGEDVTDTLASVVREQPNLDRAPPRLQRLLRKCLEKDPRQRLRDIGDAWELVDDDSRRAREVPATVSWWPWTIAAAAGLVAAGIGIVHVRETAPAGATIRFAQPWPAAASGGAGGAQFFVVSPDGGHLAIVAEGALWVRSFEALEPVRLDRTEGATYPFWSLDSTRLGFFAGGQLKTIARTGGPVQTICEAPEGRGAAWSSRGAIVFSDRFGEFGLSRVEEQGGAPGALTELGTPGSSDGHRYPQFLPGGERFLYLHLTSAPEVAGVYVGSLDGMTPVRVLEGADNAFFAPSTRSATRGHLLYRRQNALMAQAFDAGTLALSGAAVAVATDVGQGENTGLGAFSVGGGGVLAYASGIGLDRQIVWMSRTGEREANVTPRLPIDSFSVSRDARRAAFGVINPERQTETDIWIQTIGAGAPSKFTFGPAPGWMFPVWSPTDDEIAYTSSDLAGQTGYEIRRKPSNMAGVDVPLLRLGNYIWLWDWSPDGKTLVFANNGDLYLLPLEGDRKPVVFATTPGDDQYAQFSPDGRWMAYSSGTRGQTEVYVQPVPATGSLWQISKDGGTMPRWRRDGRELYYRARDGRLMAVAVGVRAGAFEPSETHEALFPVPETGNTERFTYQPSSDGRRFLVNVPVAGVSPPIAVVLNWQAASTR